MCFSNNTKDRYKLYRTDISLTLMNTEHHKACANMTKDMDEYDNRFLTMHLGT